MKLTKKQLVFRIILLIVLSFAIGVGAYSCNAKRLAGNNLPMPFGIGMATVLSGSMEPEMSVDDVIIVKRSSEYQVGDVIVFQQGYSLTVHKIIAKNGDTIITQGTANNTPDDPINVKDVKGKVIGHLPKLGRVVDFIRSPIVTFILIGAAAYLLMLSNRKERENENEDVDKLKAEIEKLKAENKDSNLPE